MSKKDPVRLNKLRQTSQAAFAASSFSSWFTLRKMVRLKIIFRSNLCTGAIFKDHSYWRDGEFHLGDKDKGANKYGGPCKGDWGTSLMVKEKDR